MVGSEHGSPRNCSQAQQLHLVCINQIVLLIFMLKAPSTRATNASIVSLRIINSYVVIGQKYLSLRNFEAHGKIEDFWFQQHRSSILIVTCKTHAG